jgi:hypothetical protein
MKALTTAALLGAALLLGACSEKVQTAGNKPQVDGKPWEGAQDPFVAAGWTPGDKPSWEQQLRKRAQGQNEYARTPIKP